MISHKFCDHGRIGSRVCSQRLWEVNNTDVDEHKQRSETEYQFIVLRYIREISCSALVSALAIPRRQYVSGVIPEGKDHCFENTNRPVCSHSNQ